MTPALAVVLVLAVQKPVVVASKPFAESYVLAEAFAQVLEDAGFVVDRRPGLGATEIAFGALRAGDIDVYPEYTGTGLLAILHEDAIPDARATYRRVASEFARRWDVHWLAPLGFENTYAMAVRPQTAERYGLRSLSDLGRASPQLVAGLTPDFIGRPDGLPALERTYGFRPRAVRSLLPSVKYAAVAAGAVDVIDGYSTDGLIARHGLAVLEDDLGLFPPYEAAALVSARLVHELPAAALALSRLSGRLDVRTMRSLNRRVEVDGEDVRVVARDALRELGIVASNARVETAPRAGGGIAAYLWTHRADTARQLGRHLLLVAISMACALLFAIPLGLALERWRAGAESAVRVTGILQTIPSIALLAFMIPLLGIGILPALVALFLYSLYPIVRSTYSGVRDAAPDAVAAAHALGMTGGQLLRHVRLPLAAPVIMAGVRTAAVINVGTATLAAFVGAGGLGEPIVAGLALSDARMILAGALPAAALAIVVDLALGAVERAVRPAR